MYPAKICYRYHPCYGVEVERIRYLRRGGDAPIVIVRLPDGRQLAIPEWMLSPEICERLRTEARPRISLEALIELRTLINAQVPWWQAIGMVVQNPQQEDRMHNHETLVARQRKLHFEDDVSSGRS